MKKPNIILFMVDQMRSDVIAALGNSEIKTPNLDRLVHRATAFSNAFSPSPVCVPARCSMHYGQYPAATGCFENDFPMPDTQPSFMDLLTAGGYRTHAVGKCHFTPDLFALRGFQSREVQEELVDNWQDDDYMSFLLGNSAFRHITDPHGVRGDMYYIPQVSAIPPKLHPTAWVGERAVDFLEKQTASPEQNWFLFCSFIHPHPPFSPPSPWHKLYRATDVSLPLINERCEENYTHINRHQNRYKFRDRGFDFNLVRCIKAYYYACISFIDYQIGKILDYLEQTKQIDNTLIVFTSDHGEHLGDNKCFGKRSMHDQAARIPLLAALPGMFEGNAVCNVPASLVDIFPTLIEAAQFKTPQACQGQSLADIASGKTTRDVVFSEYGYGEDSICMAVSEKWKYFYSVPDAKEYLFDRVNDPKEFINLADNPGFADTKEDYKNKLLRYLNDGGRSDIATQSGFKPLPTKSVSDNPDEGLLYQDQNWAGEAVKNYITGI